MTTGMLIDGIFASEAIDSSGEVLDVEGTDISDYEEGRGLANWEHRGDDAPGASGLDIVGKIAFAKKIFKASDCDDDRQRKYWDKIKLPFIYGVVRLYDGAGHEGAKALAAQVRDHVANGEPVLVRFSIEGSTLEKEGNRLKRCVARRVALTVKPCNRTCDSGLLEDPNAPEGFKKNPEKGARDVIADILETRKNEHPLYAKLGGSTEVETTLHTQKELVRSLVKARLKKALLEKAIAAGSYDAAPSTLTGGAALQREDLGRRKLVNTVKAAIRDYRPEEHGEFKKFLKNRMPEAADEFIDHFAGLVDDYRAKLRKADDQEDHAGLVDDIWGGADAAAPAEEPKQLADEDEDPAPSAGPKQYTVRGQKLQSNPELKRGHYVLNEHSGVLKTMNGTFRLYNPDKDKDFPKAGEAFRDIWHSESVRKQHDYAVRNWLRVHQAMKDGRLPHAVVATSVAFSQLSPNTPVPVHEMMYAYLVDSMKRRGYDLRDPRFGEDFNFGPTRPGAVTRKLHSSNEMYRDWVGNDKPHNFPETSRDYFQRDINDLVTIGSDSVQTGRKKGERAAFMLPTSKFANMAKYHTLHNDFVDLVARHGVDGRSAVKELMDGKQASGRWDAARKRALEAGKPDPGPFKGVAVPGLAPKTARFAYAMLGAGNIFVPDTHFTRHLFGLDKDLDTESIVHMKQGVTWNQNNSDLVGALDRWYFRNHPAVKYMLQHPEFGEHFRANPEQAIFPAFWGHWLAIAEHEASLGHAKANQASNQAASHRPIFETIQGHMEDPREAALTVPARTTPIEPSPAASKKAVFPIPKLKPKKAPAKKTPAKKVKKSESIPGGPLLHPVHAAYLLRDWVQQLGEAHAMMRFHAHLVPLLAPELFHRDDDALSVPQLRKMEALSVELRKAADGLATEEKPFSLRDASRIDVEKHEHPRFPMDEAQKKLVHGLNLMDSPTESEVPGHTRQRSHAWRKTADGQFAFVKEKYAYDTGVSEPEAEATYYHMARDFFGLGHYVPVTACVKHPRHGHEVSVQAAVPDCRHTDHGSRDDLSLFKQLGDSGELDKLLIMNAALGNDDRHYGNFLLSDNAPHIHLIDHGLAFNSFSWRPAYIGAYGNAQREFRRVEDPTEQQPWTPNETIHPEAQKWVHGLDAGKLQLQLRQHGIPDGVATRCAVRLAEIQHRLREDSNMKREKIWA